MELVRKTKKGRACDPPLCDFASQPANSPLNDTPSCVRFSFAFALASGRCASMRAEPRPIDLSVWVKLFQAPCRPFMYSRQHLGTASLASSGED